MNKRTSPPFFSIIIPVFNLEKYIHRAVSSVINQEFKDFEIIIVNDGSTDNTALIVDDLLKKFPEDMVVINHLENESLHITRMDGVAAANGQYILFLDGDDYFTDNAFSVLYKILLTNPGYDIYEFGYIRQPVGEVVFPTFTGDDRFTAYFNKEKYPAFTMWNKVYVSTKLKDAFLTMERKYLNNIEDLYESIVIAYYLKNVFRINKVIINYVIGRGISTTYKNYDETINFIISVKNKIELIHNFLNKTNQNINLNSLILNSIERIMNYITSQKSLSDKKNLYLKLPDYFDNKIIMEYFFFRENTLINSLNFKLGKIILSPLRKIKHLLFR